MILKVWIRPQIQTSGTVVCAAEMPRSYIVDTLSGELRQNHQHLNNYSGELRQNHQHLNNYYLNLVPRIQSSSSETSST